MINEARIDEMERAALAAPDTLIARMVCDLVSEVRRLRHELNDPNYLYVGRIHRQALLTREAEIDRLREELKALKGGARG